MEEEDDGTFPLSLWERLFILASCYFHTHELTQTWILPQGLPS